VELYGQKCNKTLKFLDFFGFFAKEVSSYKKSSKKRISKNCFYKLIMKNGNPGLKITPQEFLGSKSFLIVKIILDVRAFRTSQHFLLGKIKSKAVSKITFTSEMNS